MMSTAERLADVVTLPARKSGEVASATARAAFDWSTNEVDDWGRDDDFANFAWQLAQLRWDISIGGVRHLPKRSGALIVVNARRFALAPIYAAFAIGAELDRPVRFVGRPDVAPIGPVMQRLGGLIDRAHEVEGALRHGEMVVLGSSRPGRIRSSGAFDHRIVGAAVAAKVKVFPAATTSTVVRRAARVEIGRDVSPNRRRRGPLSELELADEVERRVKMMLDEMGGNVTGTPIDWLPFVGLGGF